MRKQTLRDLTVGSPCRMMIEFSIPIFLGFILQYLYSVIDTIVVGKYLGVAALAGVGATGGLNHLIVGFCNGTCSGFAIPLSIRFGQKDYDGIRRILGTILWLCVAMACLFSLTFTALCGPLLRMLKTPEEAMPYAVRYQMVLFLGIPATILYNILAGIIRSLGDARTPLLFLIISSVLNVTLDLFLVVVIRAGVVGAALATILAQLLSGLFCLGFIKKNFPILKLSPSDLRFNPGEAKHLLGMGIPMGLQVSYIGIGSTIVQSAVNTLGPAVMASVAASSRVMALLACPYDSIGTAISPYVGQNLGAHKFDRIRKGITCTGIIGTAYWIIAMGIAWFFGEDLVQFFIGPEEPERMQILYYGRMYLFVSAVGFLPLLGVNIFRFALQGMGCSKYAMISGVMEMIGRTLIALIFVPMFGFPAVCLNGGAAWTLANFFVIPMYLRVLKQMEKQAALSDTL